MSKPTRLVLSISLLATFAILGAASCKKVRLPSAEYEQAQQFHVALLGRYAEDGYDRPEADEILKLLDQVPPQSLDAEAAAQLKARILAGRQRLADQRAERERRLAAAGPATGDFSPSSSSGGAAAAPEAGPRIAPGMKVEELKAAFGDCFEMKTPINVEGMGPADAGPQAGEAWGVKDTPACKERHAAQAQSYLVFTEGVLRAVRPAADAVRTEVKETQVEKTEVLALPDGGYAQKVDGGIVPVPSDRVVKK